MAQNEISSWGIFRGGLFLILALLVSITFVIAIWPDNVPADNNPARYRVEWFHVHLETPPSSAPDGPKDEGKVENPTTTASAGAAGNTPAAKPAAATGTSENATAPASSSSTAATSPTSAPAAKTPPSQRTGTKMDKSGKLAATTKDEAVYYSFNTILLILVALGGIIGNLIHISRSFTDYVGNGDFQKSWIAWYFVTPFSAAALALGIYFALRAGFFNYSTGTANINLYGVMITSVVTGLFTDNATLKLKEVFDTLFKPKDDRSGALNTILSITGGKAEKVAGTNNVTITLTGSNMSKNKFSILVNNEAAANPKITDTSAVVVFDNTAAAASAHVVVDDDAGKSVFDQQLNIV